MLVERISRDSNDTFLLEKLGVDSGGIHILKSKISSFVIHIKKLHVGAANILKQDALSVGADLAVPRGTVVALEKKVDCILIATSQELKAIIKKELSQPFGLKKLSGELKKILNSNKIGINRVMGVLNVNDDSFYKESRFKETRAIEKIHEMIEDGAKIIDIGAVSSRPNSIEVCEKEELERVAFIYRIIKQEKLYEKAQFSCDSYSPLVIENALESGFEIINDIKGFTNEKICKLCSSYDATAVIMHMQGKPKTMQDNPTYKNLLSEVYNFLDTSIQRAESFGVKKIIIDTGIGFGKTTYDNLYLIKNLEHFLSLNKEILIGVSRKSMIDKISESLVQDRLAGTLSLNQEALRNGASVLRVHDIKENVQMINIFNALQNI